MDGVGVLTKQEFFSTKYTYDQIKFSISEYIEIARKCLKNAFYGTAMFYLKEGYYRNFDERDKQKQILEILKLKEETYSKLKMEEAAIQVRKEILKGTP